jgi:hypothetical protein
MQDVRTNPERWSHYIKIDEYTEANYMGKKIEVTLDLSTMGYASERGSKAYHILEGTIIGFCAPNEGTKEQRWNCNCAAKFAVVRIEWDKVFHSHDEFKVPMAVQLNPQLAGGADKHRALELVPA